MNIKLIDDAQKLAKKIKDYTDLDKKWAIVNIVWDKEGNDTPFSGKYSNVKRALGYVHDNTPELLIKHQVIEGRAVGWWYENVVWSKGVWGQTRPGDLAMDDNITGIAHEKRYIPKNKIVKYYFDVPTNDIGLRLRGGMSILINKGKLFEFIKLCETRKVRFDDASNCLIFLGQEVIIKGKFEKESVKLLIKNLTNVVTREEFYKVREKYPKIGANEDKDADPIDLSRAVFKRIKSKIQKNKTLKKALLLRENNGYCMDVNEKFVAEYLLQTNKAS